MVPTIVLIVCKTILVGEPDQNSSWTGWENREWAYENSMMVCRRHEVAMYDPAEGTPSNPSDPNSEPTPALPFNKDACIAAAIRLGTDWDMSHRSSPYRTWRVACPTPIIDNRTGQVVGWKLPECPHTDVVRCEVDSVI